MKPGSASFPFFGVKLAGTLAVYYETYVEVFDSHSKKLEEKGVEGKLAVSSVLISHFKIDTLH
jgi:hypothetical protein